MTKTGKRILAVVLLILTVLLVGCLCFTGNRLTNYPSDVSEYQGTFFDGKDNTVVIFRRNGVWYGTGDDEIILLELTDYTDGIITLEKEGCSYRLLAIDENTLYDETTKQFLQRRASYDEFT